MIDLSILSDSKLLISTFSAIHVDFGNFLRSLYHQFWNLKKRKKPEEKSLLNSCAMHTVNGPTDVLLTSSCAFHEEHALRTLTYLLCFHSTHPHLPVRSVNHKIDRFYIYTRCYQSLFSPLLAILLKDFKRYNDFGLHNECE